ncbi:hypothetical protein ABZX95_16900 [Streptomyces sp. NPDC004232]|uniref:hypothetical protein n=1 Tax=Streptomyces sp. NPDC004232 TaxID=3154454 RepID=UPI0033AE00C0
MSYPEPAFPIGYIVYTRYGEPLTVVAQQRADQIMAWRDRRLFSDEDAKRVPWYYTLRDSDGKESSIGESGLRHQERAVASLRAPVEQSKVPPTQRGRASVGERLRSPHGTWTVARSWLVMKDDGQGTPRERTAYLLTHEDGHQEEWLAPDMAAAGFHRILPDEQQTLT